LGPWLQNDATPQDIVPLILCFRDR
jgi:hypothetical protein